MKGFKFILKMVKFVIDLEVYFSDFMTELIDIIFGYGSLFFILVSELFH